jgi:flagellar FliJ protein
MKKFVFRLETLLYHRRNIEERERIKFSRIRGELLAELDHLETLQAKHAETRSELALKKSGECDSREISWFYRFLDRLSLEMAVARERIAQLERELEVQKQIMIEASRDKKMIENLRLKKEKEFLVSLERQEQKSIDEIVVTRFAFKQ